MSSRTAVRPTRAPLASLDLSRVACLAAAEKKAERPIILAVGDLLGVADTFVICSGSNDRQVRTIADEIQDQVRSAGGPSPSSVEGLSDASWILLDYGDVVVHVFLEETRDYYDLEHLWKGAPRHAWEPDAVAAVASIL